MDEHSREREVGNLVKLASHFGDARRFVIVTYGDEQVIEEDGVVIEVVPAHKFFLQ